jgi:hypothetical protein
LRAVLPIDATLVRLIEFVLVIIAIIYIAECRRHGARPLSSWLDAYISSAVSAVGAQMQAMQQNQLMQAQLQQQLRSQSLAPYAYQQSLGSALMNAAPSVPVSVRAEPLIDEGESIVASIAFWQEIPLVGSKLVERKLEQLEDISARLERVAEANA